MKYLPNLVLLSFSLFKTPAFESVFNLIKFRVLKTMGMPENSQY